MRNKKIVHIDYEMEMYEYTYKKLCSLGEKKNENIKDDRKSYYMQLEISVILESHMIHLRNLLHFFKYAGKHWEGDILYDDKEFKGKNNFIPERIENADKVNDIINKTISHLTEKRIEDTAKTEQLKAINETFPKMKVTIERYRNFLDVPQNNPYTRVYQNETTAVATTPTGIYGDFRQGYSNDSYLEISNLEKTDF